MSNDDTNNSSNALPPSIQDELEAYLQSQQKILNLSPDLKKALDIEDDFDASRYFTMIKGICDFDKEIPPYSIDRVTPILNQYIPEVLDRLFDQDEDFVQYFYEEWLGFLQRYGMKEAAIASLIGDTGTALINKCHEHDDFKVAYELFSISLKTIKNFKNFIPEEPALTIQKFFLNPGAEVLGRHATKLVEDEINRIGIIKDPALNKYYTIDSEISEVVKLHKGVLEVLRERMEANKITEKYIDDAYWQLEKPLNKALKGRQWLDLDGEYHEDIEWDFQSSYNHYHTTLIMCRFIYSDQKFLKEVKDFVPKKLNQFLPYKNGYLTASLFSDAVKLLMNRPMERKLFVEKSAPPVVAGMIKNNDLANAGEIMRSTKRHMGIPHDKALLVTDPKDDSKLLAIMYSFYRERNGKEAEYRQNTMVIFNENNTTLVKRFFEKRIRNFEAISFDGKDDNFSAGELQNAEVVKEEALRIKEQFYIEKNVIPGISLHVCSNNVKQKYV